MSTEEFLKVKEVAKWLRISESSVRNYIRRGFFPSIKIGKTLRIRREDVVRWLEECTRTPSGRERDE